MQGWDQNLIKIWKYNLMGLPEGWVEKVRTKEFGDKIGLGFGDTRMVSGYGGWGWRGGAMISPPTHCPRPFHLRPRPQLDFFRITRIRKSCGMIFLVWTTFHTWCRFDNSFSLNTHHAYDVECIAMNRWYQANELVIMDMKHHFQVWSGT